jgi:hypothetical protein
MARYKLRLNRFKKVDIIKNIFLPQWAKVRTDNRRKTEKCTNVWKLNNTLFFFFFLVCTQGIVLARQVLYHLSNPPAQQYILKQPVNQRRNHKRN